MSQVYIGLGSNLGRDIGANYQTPRIQLDNALEAIAQHPQIELLKVSSFYQTKAIAPTGQPDYINAAARLETDLSPLELLDFLQSVENRQGRVRTQRWGPRTLDLDILLYDQVIEHSDRLTIPHPRLHERAFVLAPLCDLAPQLVIPNKENVRQLLANCAPQGILKLPDQLSG